MSNFAQPGSAGPYSINPSGGCCNQPSGGTLGPAPQRLTGSGGLPTPAPPWLVVRSTTSSTAAQGVEPWWKCLHCEQFWTVGLRRTVFSRLASRLPRHRGRTPGLPPPFPPDPGSPLPPCPQPWQFGALVFRAADRHLCACGFGRPEKENDMDWNAISFAFVLPVFIFGAIGLGVYAQRLPG